MAAGPALEFERVSKEYRRRFRRWRVPALRDFSLRVDRGEIFGFLGPNGSGKTTAIYIALGLMLPNSGQGRMLGRSFGHAATRRRVGFLAENVALYHRPAAKLVRFYGALNGITDPLLRQRARDLLQQMNLSADADRNASTFSRGMLQRLGLAQALVNDPELLILDEPTSALDPLGRIAVREMLLRFRAAGGTIFLSSHLLSEIEQICDRVAIVMRGQVRCTGPVSTLLEDSSAFTIVARRPAAAESPLLRLTVPAGEQRAAIEGLWTQGAEIIAVNPVRRTLEELFVELAGSTQSPVDKNEEA